MTLSELGREKALRIARNLKTAFPWTDTPQGFAYWSRVHDNLVDLANSEEEDDE